MKIAIQTADLRKGLTVVSRGVSNRPQLPVLSGLLIKVSQGEVNLVATDLELSFWVKVPASVEEDGEIVVPAKLFYDLVSSLPNGKAEIMNSDKVVKITMKGTETEIVGQPSEDFPAIPRVKKIQVEIKSGEFRQKIERICSSAARDDTRPVLMGVLWEVGDQGVTLAATDGYRLSVDRLGLTKTEITSKEKFILPARSLQEVSKVLSESEEDKFGMEFDKENQQVIFKVDGIEVTSRLIAGDFPPYQQIMPNTYSTKVLFDKTELLEAVKRASLFAKDNANIVKMSNENESLTIRAESSQLGNNKSELVMESEGEKISVAFNARYLLDYLNVCSEDKIIWETEGELKPSVFRNEGNEGWTQVIMPVRVQS